jgi:mRNA-degrading endonuclease RelE of RelBE toxin-antitoxin system
MHSSFRLVYTTACKRDIKFLIGRNQEIYLQFLKLHEVLREDPYNISRKFNITKLTDTPPGEGQWRIRAGKYRLRYDIFDQAVVLYSFSHRKDAY